MSQEKTIATGSVGSQPRPVVNFDIPEQSLVQGMLHDSVELLLVPVGKIIEFAGANPPPGFLVCDGSQISRVRYKALFDAIGTTWGYGNGTTTFHLPDHRGWFTRMKNFATGRDPDAGSRTAQNAGSLGVASGTVQSGSNVLTFTPGSDVSSLGIGAEISGPGVPAGTMITGKGVRPWQVTMSANASSNTGGTYTSSNGAMRDNVGSFQDWTTARPRHANMHVTGVGDHVHFYIGHFGDQGQSGGCCEISADEPEYGANTGGAGAHDHYSPVFSTPGWGGDNETRMRNAYVLKCIKY